MEKLIIAIDFGTTTTVVCADIQGTGNPVFLKDENSPLIPSMIYVRNDGSRCYGKRAEKESGNPNGFLIDNFKMGLQGEKKEIYKGYIKEFLKNHIYRLYKQQALDFPKHSDVVVRVGYPSIWSNELIQFMVEAVRYAGFTGCIETIPEPLAVSAYSLLCHQDILKKESLLEYDTEYNVIIIDMGGGTSDIVLCKIIIDEKGQCKIYDSQKYPKLLYDLNCSGSELDSILLKYVLSKLPQDYHPIFKIRDAKLWKEQFVSKDLECDRIADTPSRIVDILSFLPISFDGDLSNLCTIDRQRFEEWTTDYWDSYANMLQDAFTDYENISGVSQGSIDFVILTGGHSQWYCLSDIMINRFHLTKIQNEPVRILKCPNPNETVARGLCSYEKEIICNHYYAELVAYDTNIFITNDSSSRWKRRHTVLDGSKVLLPFNCKKEGNAALYTNHSIRGESIRLCVDFYVKDYSVPYKSFSNSFCVRSSNSGDYKIEFKYTIIIDEKSNVEIFVDWLTPQWSIDNDDRWDDDFDDWKGIYDAHIGGL